MGAALLLGGWACLALPGVSRSEETVLEGSGICYPAGFDVNTVGTVQGRARGFTLVERGPIRFRLAAGDKTYTVLCAPRWYWPEALSLADGTEVRVRGSKALGRDGTLYVIAEEVSLPAAGVALRLRDSLGRPLWLGGRQHRGGAGSRQERAVPMPCPVDRGPAR